MTAHTLQTILSLISPVSIHTAEQLLPHTHTKRFVKGEFIETAGQRIKYQFIVRRGIIRQFLTNQQGEQFTNGFFTDGQAIPPAIVRGVDFVSYVNLEVLSKEAEIICFSYSGMQQSMEGNKELAMFGYNVIMQHTFERAEREKILLTGTGTEKLEWLRAHYPNIENHVPHYHIASFMGLTPTSLSRIRQQLAEHASQATSH